MGAWQRRLRNTASPAPETTQERALFTEVSLQGAPDGYDPAAPPAPRWDVGPDLGDGICMRVRRRPC
ncbi:MAG: hypothetical protein FKY71_14060 [Spiribacter salinus]|uniref:Uncharacterized protein n=1 Tax=Spiribacter salinus TaxID=1335746 RepID=A0A540VNP9_9GAMM|nr:MAG: hypothetical protein FKY71_14060 [Spiribacter salinus]